MYVFEGRKIGRQKEVKNGFFISIGFIDIVSMKPMEIYFVEKVFEIL